MFSSGPRPAIFHQIGALAVEDEQVPIGLEQIDISADKKHDYALSGSSAAVRHLGGRDIIDELGRRIVCCTVR